MIAYESKATGFYVEIPDGKPPGKRYRKHWPDDAVQVPPRPAPPPPGPAERDAEAAAMADAIEAPGTVVQALAAEVYALANAADPALTKRAFKRRIRAAIRAGLK